MIMALNQIFRLLTYYGLA